MWDDLDCVALAREDDDGLMRRARPATCLGLQNTATGTFESPAVDQVQAANQLSQVLQAIANPQQFHDVDAQAALKHLWVYIDRA
jgi:hypothetical protein